MQNTIVYANLRAELSRKNISIGDLAELIGMNRTTLGRKLSKNSPLYLDEAIRICEAIASFDELRYLFAEACPRAS